jgi:hypothetical protein
LIGPLPPARKPTNPVATEDEFLARATEKFLCRETIDVEPLVISERLNRLLKNSFGRNSASFLPLLSEAI